jgi:outer membrane protein TolC
MKFLVSPAIIFCLAFSACQSYTPKPLNPAVSIQSFLSRTLDTPALREELRRAGLDPRPDHWDLPSLTIAALHFNPELETARAKLPPLRAAVETAGEVSNPSISWTPQFSSNPAMVPPWALGLTFDIPIETANKRELRIQAAQANLRPTELALLQAAWDVRMKVRDALLNCKQARDIEEVLNSEKKLLDARRSLFALYAARGQASALVILEAKRKEQSNRQELEDVHFRRIQCLNALAAAIGIAPNAVGALSLSFTAFEKLPSFTTQQTADLQDRALQTRSDILTAIAEYQVREASLKLEVAKQYPDIRISPGYTYDQGEHKWELGWGVILPLFSQNRGPIHEAEAKRAEAAAAFSTLQGRVISEVQSQFNEYQALVTAVDIAKQNLAVQKQYMDRLGKQLTVGELAKPLLLAAKLDVIAARKTLVSSYSQAQSKLGALEDTLQTSFSDSFDSALSRLAPDPRK